MQVKKSFKRASYEQGIAKSDPEPVFYREVDSSYLPSQYTKDIET